jgi:tRNA threonylcarbamoyladenosine biosynthesis protein TsaE
MEIIYKLDEIDNIAAELLSLFENYKVIAFTGDLGSGKTTLINSICKQLEVEEAVTSPTYSIIQEYHSTHENIVYHIDLYRVKNDEEAIEAGVEEVVLSGNLCFIEWPGKAIAIIPEKTVYITLRTLSENVRKMVVQLP